MIQQTKEIVQEDREDGRQVALQRDDVMTGRDLERRQKVSGLLRPVAAPEDVLAAQTATRELVAKALQVDRDYGVIPGTGKPTLLKPGAERINAAFGVAPRYRIMESEVDHDREVRWTKRRWEWHPTERGKKVWSEETGTSEGLYRYVVESELVHRESGVVIGQGIGSCSTMESKYIDRPRECENVTLKMAQKRALIAATLNAYGLSDQFTQDVEDLDLGHDSTNRGPKPPITRETPCPFKKHKGMPWGDVIEQHAGYVRWALDNMDNLDADLREFLQREMEAKESGGDDDLGPRRGKILGAIQRAWQGGAINDQEAETLKVKASNEDAEGLDRVVDFLRTKAEEAEAEAQADTDEGLFPGDDAA